MKLKRLGHLAILWLVAMAISALTFSRIYDDFPSVSEIVGTSLIYGVLALPFSFLHSVTFHGSEALRVFGGGFLLLIASYWTALGVSQIAYIRQGSKISLLVSIIIVLVSSFRWLYYAMAMSGI